jgi:hypothetical protein
MSYVITDSGERQTFGSGMVRDTATNKPRYDLIDRHMLRRWADHMGKGAVKYKPNNWKRAATHDELWRFVESAMRHLLQYVEDLDVEFPQCLNDEAACSVASPEDHAAAVFFNLAGSELVRRKLRSGPRNYDSEDDIVGVTAAK